MLQGSSAAPQQAAINPSVVKKLLQLHWGKDKDKAADGAKINPDAVVLASEYLRLFVIGEKGKHVPVYLVRPPRELHPRFPDLLLSDSLCTRLIGFYLAS